MSTLIINKTPIISGEYLRVEVKTTYPGSTFTHEWKQIESVDHLVISQITETTLGKETLHTLPIPLPAAPLSDLIISLKLSCPSDSNKPNELTTRTVASTHFPKIKRTSINRHQ